MKYHQFSFVSQKRKQIKKYDFDPVSFFCNEKRNQKPY